MKILRKLLNHIRRERIIKGNKPVTLEVNGVKGLFHINGKDEYKVILGGLSERALRVSIMEAIRPDDVVLEIGAHVGAWSVYLAKSVPEGQLHVFEPLPGNYQKLLANLELNGLNNANVVTHQLAVGDRLGQADFFTFASDAPAASSLYENANNGNRITVEMDCLDHLVETMSRPPTFLKIDCEGGEAMVLRGAGKTLDSSVRAIFLEVHTPFLETQGEDIDAMIQGITDKGFEVRQRWDWNDGFDGYHLLLMKDA